MNGFKVTIRTVGAKAQSVELGRVPSRLGASLLVKCWNTGLQHAAPSGHIYNQLQVHQGVTQILLSKPGKIKPGLFAVVYIEPCEIDDQLFVDFVDRQRPPLHYTIAGEDKQVE